MESVDHSVRCHWLAKALTSFAVFGSVLFALSGAMAEAERAPVRTAVSIPPQVWLVEQISGGRVEVESLLGPSDSPATFQPTDADITDLLRSQLFFRIGVPFERADWMTAVESSGRVRVVDTREGIELQPIPEQPGLSGSTDPHDHSHSHDHGDSHSHTHSHNGGHHHGHDHGPDGLDPHIWLSPRLLQKQAATVVRHLQEIDPGSRELYQERLADLQRRLQELDERLEASLAPYRGRSFMVFHPSWGYFAEDYGLQQIAIEIEGKEPTDRELTQLARLADEQEIRVVFFQPQFESRAARAVAGVLGARLVETDPLEKDIIGSLERLADLLIAGFVEKPDS